MLGRRELRPLLAVALLGVALACVETFGGVHTSLLHLAPVVALLLPLLAGRYVGEERIAALAAAVARSRRSRRHATAAPGPSVRRPAADLARGGRLLGASLARRGPPRAALVPAR